MVQTEHSIVSQVYAAKTDPETADMFIQQYMGFIRSETVKFIRTAPEDGHEDELSIAMIAFHEAISGYSSLRGSFLHYAGMLIKSRLIDHARKEQRHRHALSLDAPIGEETEGTLLDAIH